MKRIITFICIITLSISSITGMNNVYVYAEEEENYKDYSYEILSDGSIRIMKYNGSDSVVEVPQKIDGRQVTVIGEECFAKRDAKDGWFTYNETLQKVIIPDGVISIEKNAFWCCNNLKEASLPDSIEKLEEMCFGYCESLKQIKLPENLKRLEDSPFYATGISHLDIPKNVEYIDPEMFKGYCTDINSIEVAKENQYYISYNGNLYNKECTELIAYITHDTEINILDSVKKIGDNALIDFYGERTVVVNFPDSVEEIGNNFRGFEKTSVKIPKNVKQIGQIECPVEKIELDADNQNFCIENGTLYNKNKTILIKHIDEIELSKFVVPETVQEIKGSAFSSLIKLSNIQFPEKLEIIGRSAFRGTVLENIVLPDSVKYVGEYAFAVDSEKLLVTIKNPKCVIAIDELVDDFDGETIGGYYTDTTIIGYIGSTAEIFANTYGRKFVDINTFSGNDNNPTFGWNSYFSANGGAEGTLVNVECDGWTTVLESIGQGGIWGAQIFKQSDGVIEKGKKCTLKCNLTSSNCDKWICIAVKQEDSYAYGRWIKLEKGKETSINETFIAQNDADMIYFGFGGESNGGALMFNREVYLFLDGGTDILDNEAPNLSTQIECRNISLVATEETITQEKPNEQITQPITTKYEAMTSAKATTNKSKENTTPKKILATKIKSIKKAKKSLKVSWKKVSGISGYQIQYCTSSRFKNAKTITIKKSKTTSKTIKKLQSKKKYYVRIRTYIMISGKKKYSSWSKKKSQKTK